MHRRRRSGPGRLVIEIGSRLYNDLETKIQLLIIQRHLRMAKGVRNARRREGGGAAAVALSLHSAIEAAGRDRLEVKYQSKAFRLEQKHKFNGGIGGGVTSDFDTLRRVMNNIAC